MVITCSVATSSSSFYSYFSPSCLHLEGKRSTLPRSKTVSIQSPSQPRRRVNSECKADPFRFLLALIGPPVAGIQSSIQPTESMKIVHHILQTAWKPSHHSFLYRESVHAYILSLAPSQALIVGTLLPNKSLVSSP
jgi:hypothetical protein